MEKKRQTNEKREIMWSSIVLVLPIFLLKLTHAEEVKPLTYSQAENQSVELNLPAVTASTISTLKRNEWWPPSAQEIVEQTSPYTELQQPVSPNYYVPAPPPPPPPPLPVTHYRSDPWSPYGYPEFGYPVLPQHANNQIAVPTKYMTVALFIGLLTLFAIIQGAMMATRHKESLDILPARRKRDLFEALEYTTPEQQEVLNNDARIRCIQLTICLENHQLLKDFGAHGAKLGNYLTRIIEKSLNTTSGWNRLVEDAGIAGLRGDDCNVLYRDCILPVALKSIGNN